LIVYGSFKGERSSDVAAFAIEYLHASDVLCHDRVRSTTDRTIRSTRLTL
jgi:hypothetical protein